MTMPATQAHGHHARSPVCHAGTRRVAARATAHAAHPSATTSGTLTRIGGGSGRQTRPAPLALSRPMPRGYPRPSPRAVTLGWRLGGVVR